MPTLPASAVLPIINAIACLIAQAYQLARIRLASAASPILRLLLERDEALTDVQLLNRELQILRAQRQQMPPHRRPEYRPHQRLAILQLKTLRGWSVDTTARRFVLHPNTIRSWIKASQGTGNPSLFADAVPWNRLHDAVRWAVHELRQLCKEPELGTHTIARHLVRAGIAISRSTVQRILRESPARPTRPRKPAMAEPAGITPHGLLCPTHPNQVWHMDLSSLRLLWFGFTIAVILDGFSRKLLAMKVYLNTPCSRHLAALVRHAASHFGPPRFLITDHGTQFRREFHSAMKRQRITHVRARVRAPYLNGKVERFFKTFRLWWRLVLTGLTRSSIQRRLDTYRHWYNHHRPHSALAGRTPEEAYQGIALPTPLPIRAKDKLPPRIDIQRLRCRGDPRLPVIQITLTGRRAA